VRTLALLLLITPLLADPETADFFLTRAKTALDAGQLEKATKFIDRSLEEEEGYLPALLMKARVALRGGEKAEAIRHLEAVLKKKQTASGAAERRAVAEAEEMIGKLDRARLEFDKLRSEYIDKLLELARESAKRKPKLAEACYHQILAVQPDHAEALRKLQSKSKSKGKAKPRVRGVQLFNGKNLKGWSGEAPSWTVNDRILNARLDGIAQINQYKDEVKGNFEYICEPRFVETMGNDPLIGILFGGRSRYDHFGLWIWDGSLRLERQTGEHARSELQRKSALRLPGDYDREEWHVYKIVHKSKRITVFVDGEEVFSFAGADRALDGFVGLWAQDSLIEIRKITLVR